MHRACKLRVNTISLGIAWFSVVYFFFLNKSFITQIDSLQSHYKHLCKKLGGVSQTQLSNVAEACWAQRCATKFDDFCICISLKDVKAVAISSMSFRIVVASQRLVNTRLICVLVVHFVMSDCQRDSRSRLSF